MSTNYEPTPEAIEAEAKAIAQRYKDTVPCGTGWLGSSEWWRNYCRGEAKFILQRQHERESILRDGMQAVRSVLHPGSWEWYRLGQALKAHAALDAPPAPTLLEAAKQVINGVTVGVFKFGLGTHIALNGWPTAVEDMQALKAAVEREERAK